MSPVRIDIVIVNYRCGRLAVDALASLAGEVATSPGSRVVVVDNDSGDDSVAVLEGAIAANGWGGWASVVPAGRNGGFAFGNNVGIERTGGTEGEGAVLLLNPDTVVRPGMIAALAGFLAERPRAGIVGCRLEDPDGTPQGCGHPFPTPLRELQRAARIGALSRIMGPLTVPEPRDAAAARPERCGWVSGAALCVRREVLRQIGMMDEGYFLYFEEVDLCKRAVDAGWEVWTAPGARVVHLEGSATGITQRKKRRPRYWFDSRRRYFLKHHGVVGLAVADALWLIGRGMLRTRGMVGLARGVEPMPPRFTGDLLAGDIGAMLRPRAWRPATVQPRERAPVGAGAVA